MFKFVRETTATALESVVSGLVRVTVARGYTLPLKDGTQGIRWNWIGRKGMYRKRVHKRRYGVQRGEVMTGVHCGLVSFYYEHRKGPSHRRLWDSWAWRRIFSVPPQILVKDYGQVIQLKGFRDIH